MTVFRLDWNHNFFPSPKQISVLVIYVQACIVGEISVYYLIREKLIVMSIIRCLNESGTSVQATDKHLVLQATIVSSLPYPRKPQGL